MLAGSAVSIRAILGINPSIPFAQYAGQSLINLYKTLKPMRNKPIVQYLENSFGMGGFVVLLIYKGLK